jgi:hypothetical protein
MEVMERKGSSPKCASMAGCVSEQEYERHGNMHACAAVTIRSLGSVVEK